MGFRTSWSNQLLPGAGPEVVASPHDDGAGFPARLTAAAPLEVLSRIILLPRSFAEKHHSEATLMTDG